MMSARGHGGRQPVVLPVPIGAAGRPGTHHLIVKLLQNLL